MYTPTPLENLKACIVAPLNIEDITLDEAKADASEALGHLEIVVNSYEAMREALKGAQNDINFHGGKLSGGTIDAIKKALALAEGKE